MKKICFMMPTVFNIGGEQRVVSCLSNALSDIGYDITLLLFNNKFDENFELYNLNNKIKIKYVKKYYSFFHKTCRRVRNLNSKFGFLKRFRKLQEFFIKWSFPYLEVKKELSNIKPDVLIGVSGDYSLLCSFLKKDFEFKTIGWQHSCHDAYFNTKNNRHINEKKSFSSLVQNGIDKYIVLTKTDKEKFENEFKIKVDYIYNMKSFESKQKANLDSKQMIAAGRLVSLKGFDLLLEAFSFFHKTNPGWTLKIVGDGEERENLQRLAEKYHITNNVIFYGYCNNMRELYCESSIYVLSSKWEGFPMVLTECMETGLPMISFEIDVMKEFIENEKDGILVPKYDVQKLSLAMDKMANDEKLRKKISMNCLKKIEQLSKENIVKQWIKILEERG